MRASIKNRELISASSVMLDMSASAVFIFHERISNSVEERIKYLLNVFSSFAENFTGLLKQEEL